MAKWTEQDREQFNNFINEVLYEKLTTQDYHNIMRKLGANYNGSRFNTICHNVDGGKYNLAFNEDDKYNCGVDSINVEKKYPLLRGCKQFGRQNGHSTVLGAYIGADLYCKFVCLIDGFAVEDGGAEGTRERVTGANGIGHLNLGCRLEGHFAGFEHIGTVGATGEYQHVEIVLAQNEPALILHVQTGIAKHTANDYQFLVIDFKDVATAQ